MSEILTLVLQEDDMSLATRRIRGTGTVVGSMRANEISRGLMRLYNGQRKIYRLLANGDVESVFPDDDRRKTQENTRILTALRLASAADGLLEHVLEAAAASVGKNNTFVEPFVDNGKQEVDPDRL